MTAYVGTSGWQYRDWRGSFYPQPLAQRAWLEFYSERFQTVEVNNTFYRLPPPETFEAWKARTPDDFVIAPKASRYLTHIKRLRDPAEPVARFVRHASALGPKLGPVLLQFPPDLKADVSLLEAALEEFPRTWRLAAEFRHASWFTDDLLRTLAARDVALCLADRGGKPTGPLERTATWGYVRFHEGTAHPRPCYPAPTLARWSDTLARLWRPEEDVFVFFNNDPRGCALRDAVLFARALHRSGLQPTRVPERKEVAVVA